MFCRGVFFTLKSLSRYKSLSRAVMCSSKAVNRIVFDLDGDLYTSVCTKKDDICMFLLTNFSWEKIGRLVCHVQGVVQSQL